jgi:hypothetical protein
MSSYGKTFLPLDLCVCWLSFSMINIIYRVMFIPRQTDLASQRWLKILKSTESVSHRLDCMYACMRLEFVLQCIFSTGLAGLRLDVQVDEEETWEECSKKDSQVSSELNFQGKRSGGKSINNGVHGKGRGGKSSNWHRGGGSLGKSLGDCVLEKK